MVADCNISNLKSLLYFVPALFAEVCLPNLKSFVWRGHVCALRRNTNIAAVT